MPTTRSTPAAASAKKAAAKAARSPGRPARAKAAAAKTRTPLTDAEKHAERTTKVLRRFRVIFNAVKTHFRSVEHQAGVSGAQLWALSVIDARPGAGINQLAAAMDLHQSTASNLVRALTEAGLVVSAREGDDRRAVQLYLTPRGHRILARAPGPFSGILPEALAQMDAQTLARLDRDLAAVIRQIAPHAQGGNVPLGDSTT
jgi:DNA-binding MarR family transcriptional regulator